MKVSKIESLSLLIVIMLFSGSLMSQNPIFEWGMQMGGFGNEEGFSIATDSFGNVYTTGYFEGTVDFNPNEGSSNLISSGDLDIFIQKLDSEGNFIWAKRIGGSGLDLAYSIAIDDFGNIHITGAFSGTVDFDPGIGVTNLTSLGDIDIFIQKLDSGGNFQWAKRSGGSGRDFANDIATDLFGNVFSVGVFELTGDFGEEIFNGFGEDDIFIQKLDSDGNILWTHQIGGIGNDSAESVILDDNGNIYITGTFSLTVDFDPTKETANLSSAGGTDIFILKLDNDGALVWIKRIGGSSAFGDFALSITVDAFGDVYTTGNFRGTVDFDPGLGVENFNTLEEDLFIQKLDADGNYLWAKHMSGTDFALGYSIAVDFLGNVYTTGRFSGSVDFDPDTGFANLTAGGVFDTFIQKLDNNGNYVWARQIISTNFANNVGLSIALDASGNVYTIGRFSGNVDVNSSEEVGNLSSVGGRDVFIQKLSQCTANSIDVSTSSNGIGITANSPDGIYQWLDCDNNNTPISGEYNQSFIATNSGNYAVQIIINGCIDTSECISVSTVGLNEFDSNSRDQFDFKLFPNPSQNGRQMTLEVRNCANILNLEVSIFSADGRQISNFDYRNHDNLIMLNQNLSSGSYLLKIRNDAATRVKPFLIR